MVDVVPRKSVSYNIQHHETVRSGLWFVGDTSVQVCWRSGESAPFLDLFSEKKVVELERDGRSKWDRWDGLVAGRMVVLSAFLVKACHPGAVQVARRLPAWYGCWEKTQIAK